MVTKITWPVFRQYRGASVKETTLQNTEQGCSPKQLKLFFSVKYKTFICQAEWLKMLPQLDLGLVYNKKYCQNIVING